MVSVSAMPSAVRHRPRPFKDSGALHALFGYERADDQASPPRRPAARRLRPVERRQRRRGPAAAAPGQRPDRLVRGRLLLVGRARHRGGAGRGRGGVGLRRRPRRQSELRAGGARRHRPSRGGAGDLRSGADQLSRSSPAASCGRSTRPTAAASSATAARAIAPRSSRSTRRSGATPRRRGPRRTGSCAAGW